MRILDLLGKKKGAAKEWERIVPSMSASELIVYPYEERDT